MSKPKPVASTLPQIGSVPEKHEQRAHAHQNRDDEHGAHKASHAATGVGPLAPQQSIADARSLASVDRLSTGSNVMIQVPSSAYHPFSPAVVALLMPASIFGVLARLGLQALANYDGKAIFPLAYPQAVGCLVMGIALSLKDPISS
jgi:fluoride exporter